LLANLSLLYSISATLSTTFCIYFCCISTTTFDTLLANLFLLYSYLVSVSTTFFTFDKIIFTKIVYCTVSIIRVFISLVNNQCEMWLFCNYLQKGQLPVLHNSCTW
jgi:hypothetical protein